MKQLIHSNSVPIQATLSEQVFFLTPLLEFPLVHNIIVVEVTGWSLEQMLWEKDNLGLHTHKKCIELILSLH